ncbi:3-hydroxyacyl-CoA dehydrogenase NAD-binding domain-containing protein, partial [Sphingorhabdus sp.]|uniref:3-hydroxyacyl-CoA dehydrogenase NAD-binding domain-containing protein n=1 Tax=Sphingorhabdus sp. TaxID=1902408 RepID=UPI003BAE398E
MQSVTTRKDGEILIITVDNPPVNVLSWHVRNGLSDGIKEALADDGVKAAVLICAGQTFIAGADITEFQRSDLPESVNFLDVLTAFEGSTKLLVAAIHGTALGGGLETALCCHYRIAVPSAKLGLPEVKLGLLPGGGGTQRLPRVVGVEQAAVMVSLGEPISAQKALESGLVDALAGEASLEADAIALARACIAKGPRPTRDLPVNGDLAVIEKLKADNARKWKGFDAPYANLRCIEAAAANTNIDDGLKIEREEFGKLMMGSQSAAQRHIFFAERQAAKIDGLPKDTKLRDVKKVGVIGAGTMGGGISMNFLQKGIAVTIVEMAQENLDRGVGVIRKNYEASAAKGRYSSEQVEGMMGLLTPTLSLDDLADCDLVIEAVYESMDVKKDVFGKLDAICKPGAILASNTSYLNVNEIASATNRPQAVLGMHFFSPANVMKLLEVVRGEKTADDVLATAMAIGKKIGKVAVVAGVCDGFIGNRMLSKRQQPANELLMEGATPQQIDNVFTEFGFPMGPFQMADLAGMDIGWHRDTSKEPTNVREAMCLAGRFGQKNGKGFYDYDEKRNRTPSPEALAIIEDFRSKSNRAKREIS